MIRIEIGIVGQNPGWKLLLAQEGVPHATIETADDLRRYSAIVAGDDCPQALIGPLKNYLQQGGGVLCSGIAFEKISGIPSAGGFIRWLIPEPESPFSESGLTDIFLDGHIPGGANTVVDANGRCTVLNREYMGGYIVGFPFDPASVVLDERPMTKSFYAARSRLPYERVTAVTKNSVRVLFGKGLEILHHARGYLYGHLWYYPNDGRPIAAFRVDTDFAGQRDVEELLSLSQHERKPFTWVIDLHSQEANISIYRQMEDQDLALHCYRHAWFHDKRDALNDLSHGMEVLRRNNVAVRTCALPYGQWSAGLGEALEEIGVRFSSEFSYDADNLPSAPYLGTRFSGVVQIPVHPISIGTLSRQGFRADDMLAYYRLVIGRKLRLREPVILYHHPKNHHTDVLKTVLTDLAGSSPDWMTMTQFGEWWRRRNLSGVTIECSEVDCRIGSEQPIGECRVRLTRADGTEVFLSREGVHDLRNSHWVARPHVPRVPDDIGRIRKFNPWIPIQRMEDKIFGLGKY